MDIYIRRFGLLYRSTVKNCDVPNCLTQHKALKSRNLINILSEMKLKNLLNSDRCARNSLIVN